MKVAVVCFKKDVEKLKRVIDYLSSIYEVDFVIYDGNWEKLLSYDCIIAYIASGIVIRGLCPLLRNKWVDPAVIVLDKPLKHAIVLLGGHHGGNEIAKKLESIGIEAVITTGFSGCSLLWTYIRLGAHQPHSPQGSLGTCHRSRTLSG